MLLAFLVVLYSKGLQPVTIVRNSLHVAAAGRSLGRAAYMALVGYQVSRKHTSLNLIRVRVRIRLRVRIRVRFRVGARVRVRFRAPFRVRVRARVRVRVRVRVLWVLYLARAVHATHA